LPLDLDVSVDARALIEALTVAKRFAERRTTIPVLSFARLWTAGEHLYLDVTDLVTSHRMAIGRARIGRHGHCLASIESLSRIAKSLSGDIAIRSERTVTAGSDGNEIVKASLHLTWSAGTTTLHTIPVEDFPTLPFFPPAGDSTHFDGPELRAALAVVLPAVSSEESRFQLSAMLWDVRETETLFIATDGHRLHKISVSSQGTGARQPLLIPRGPLSALQRGKAAAWRGTWRLAVGEHHVELLSDHGVTVSRIAEGTFPDWERFIPKNPTFTADVDAATLKDALSQVRSATAKDRPCVRATMNGSIHLHAQNPELGSSEAECPVLSSKGPEVTAGLNPDYLADICRHMDTMRIEARTANDSILCRSGSFEAVIMPIRL